MSNSGTSLVDKSLFHYIHIFYPDALYRYTIKAVGELDIFIPSINTGIEYDGGYWHQKKLLRDNKKNKLAKDSGINLIRIRDPKLPSTEDAYYEIRLEHHIRISEFDYDIEPLNSLLNKIGTILQNKELENFVLSLEEHLKVLTNIYCGIYNKPVENNLSDVCGIKLWDKKYNGKLKPEFIPKYMWACAMLRCKNGQRIILPRYHRAHKKDCEKRGFLCNKCLSQLFCPFLDICPGNVENRVDCQYVEDRVRKMIEKGRCYQNYTQAGCFGQWLCSKSILGKKLLKEVLAMPENDDRKIKYYQFLGFYTKKYGFTDESEEILLEKLKSKYLY